MRMSDWSSDVCSSDLISTSRYQMVATGFAPDYGKAAALGMSILSASIALIVLYRALTAESGKYVTISGRGYRLSTIELKRARTPLFIAISLLSFLMVVLPVAVLLYTSLVPYSMVPSARAFSLMSLKHWIEVLEDPLSLRSEEHTSELQSLMRISYAVFCLKKKK